MSIDSRDRNTTSGVAGYSRSTSAPSTRAAPYSWRVPGRLTGSPTVTKDDVVIEYAMIDKAELQNSMQFCSAGLPVVKISRRGSTALSKQTITKASSKLTC